MIRIAAAIACVALITGCAHVRHDSNELTTNDERFVSEMIPHHELGMRLINDATLRSHDVRLRRMVFEMAGYHGSELEQLHVLAHSHGVDHAERFPGSLSTTVLDQLSAAEGPAHDILWLNLMITHHEGALAIADAALTTARSETVVTIARNTKTIQTKELDDMRKLLAEMCAVGSSFPGC